MKKVDSGFSLIEFSVVFVIIGLLVAVVSSGSKLLTSSQSILIKY